MTLVKRPQGQQFSKSLDFIKMWRGLLLPFIMISLVKELPSMKAKNLKNIYEIAV